MIIVVQGNPQTGQVQMSMEGCDGPTARNVLAQLVKMIDEQIAKQGNGQRPSGLIVPPTVIPRNIKGEVKDE
jgi:hypothetical protein